jgi:hypothetical protein
MKSKKSKKVSWIPILEELAEAGANVLVHLQNESGSSSDNVKLKNFIEQRAVLEKQGWKLVRVVLSIPQDQQSLKEMEEVDATETVLDGPGIN